MNGNIRIGISSCLLGENVRYDGGHRLDRFLTETLGKYVEYVPVCPEVECGFPIPREAMRLVGDPESPRLLTVRSKQDHTERMLAWARKRVAELEKENLCGFVFKSDSPSSGRFKVKVYDAKGSPPVRKGVGLFARTFAEHFPRIPTEDDGRLHDPEIRENFIERIFAFQRWRELIEKGKSRGGLVEFHTRHKLLILSHSEKHYREMGRLVARAKELGPIRLYDEYERLLMEALTLFSTPKKHTNVLMHMMGYMKEHLTADEKQEMLSILENYRHELIPLIVPVTLLNHYVRKYAEPYLAVQLYLNPHPLELKLRNHV
jgi:uncharacterized protein YbgA (DUF1722 family)/uncharacterized protein YbbK (DUF523 family)